MSFTRIRDAAVKVIRNLPNRPTGTGYMSAVALKAAFDQAAENIKETVNKFMDDVEATSGAAQIGFQRSSAVPADNVQEAIENVQEQLQGISQGSVANNSITAEKLAPGALRNWVDVSSQITLTPLIGPHEEYIERKNVRKSFWYNPALGIVRFSLLVGLFTTDAAHYIAFKQEGLYLPKMIAGHTAALAVSSGGEGPAEMDAEYEVDTAQDNVTFTFSVNSSVDYTYRVSGWYICDGPGESEEE